MAIVKAASSSAFHIIRLSVLLCNSLLVENMHDLTPEKFIPSLVEWMEGKEGDLAAHARDVVIDFVALGMLGPTSLLSNISFFTYVVCPRIKQCYKQDNVDTINSSIGQAVAARLQVRTVLLWVRRFVYG